MAQDENQSVAEAELVPTYDTHLKFIGKKLSDINNTLEKLDSKNLSEINDHVSWLALAVKISFFMMVLSIIFGFLALAG